MRRDPAFVLGAAGLAVSLIVSLIVAIVGDDRLCTAVTAALVAPVKPAESVKPAEPDNDAPRAAAVVAPAQPIAAAPAPTLAPAAPPPIVHVVIISEDGLRPDALDATVTPRHIALMREGLTARQAETIPESDTLPSHASMLSGVGAAAHGLWWNSYKADKGYIHVPTVFAAAHERGLTTAMIVGKPKLQHIATPGTVDHYERPSYLCGGVSKRAAEYFRTDLPALLFVHGRVARAD